MRVKYPRLIAFVAGLLAALGFAPLNLWPLTLIGLAILLTLVRNAPSWRAAVGRGWWWGLGHFIICNNWIAHAFDFQDNMPHWLGYGAVVVLAAYLAVFVAAAAAGSYALTFYLSGEGRGRDRREGLDSGLRRKTIAFTLIFAAAWIINEYLRATVFTGYIWDPIGVAMLPSGLRRAAPIIGTYGMSGLSILAAGLLSTRVTVAKAKLLLVAPALLVLCALWALGGIDVAQPDWGTLKRGIPILEIIQPNIPEQDRHDARTDFTNLIKLMRETAAPTIANSTRHVTLTSKDLDQHPRLIFWPEGALTDYVEDEPWARTRLATLLRPRDILVAGGEALVVAADGHVKAARNSSFVIDAQADILGRYDKAHLVPYGEYLPMRPLLSLIGLNRLVPGDLDFLPGPGPRTLNIPGFGKMGNIICYEAIFSGEVVDRAQRPDFIFNPSSDAWFGSWGPPQHLAQAQMRALEEGLPIIRSTPTGISAVIDADGRLMQSLPQGAQGTIITTIPPAHAPTLFAHYGNAIPLMFAVALALLGIALHRRRR